MDQTLVESSKKRARIEKSASDQLVLCFLKFGEDYSYAYYSFEFFPIQVLLDFEIPPLVSPARTLTWPDNIVRGSECPNVYLSFLHSRLSREEDADGLGVLYAVGGLPISDYSKLGLSQLSLPSKLTSICFSGDRIVNDCDFHMNGGKLFPLIEEIDDLIYVLSGPTNSYGPDYKESANTFEVYDPLDNSCKLLDEFPLISSPSYKTSRFVQKRKYAHLVFGRKLFVSDGLYACVYDISSNTWNACYLFSDCYIPDYLPKPLLPRCGPGFPFKGKAVLWKDKFFVCIPSYYSPGDIITAFRIVKDDECGEEKVVPLKVCIERVLYRWERVLQLVKIGEDHFALAMLRYGGQEEGHFDTVFIITFKLEIDATTKDCLLVKDLNTRYSCLEPDYTFFNSGFVC